MTIQGHTLSSPYERLGGAAAVEALVNRFYDFIETEPSADALRLMHLRGHGLAHAREAQFLFLSGFLGGPKLYFEQHGHQDVRAIHAHLAIDAAARDAWLHCMRLALEAERVDPALAGQMMTSFTRVAGLLTNA